MTLLAIVIGSLGLMAAKNAARARAMDATSARTFVLLQEANRFSVLPYAEHSDYASPVGTPRTDTITSGRFKYLRRATYTQATLSEYRTIKVIIAAAARYDEEGLADLPACQDLREEPAVHMRNSIGRSRARARLRRGFTLVEMLTTLVILGIIGSALIKLIMVQARFSQNQMALRSARNVSRDAMNIMLTDLRMVQDSGGLVAASRDSVTVRIPIAFGLVCSTVGSTTISLLPADSAILALGVYAGYAIRDSASGLYNYTQATTPTPVNSLANGVALTCTNAGITTIGYGSTPARIVSLLDLPVGNANAGWPAFIYQLVTYKFAGSSAYPGRRGCGASSRRAIRTPRSRMRSSLRSTPRRSSASTPSTPTRQQTRCRRGSATCVAWSWCSREAATKCSRTMRRPGRPRWSLVCSSRTGETHETRTRRAHHRPYEYGADHGPRTRKGSRSRWPSSSSPS